MDESIVWVVIGIPVLFLFVPLLSGPNGFLTGMFQTNEILKAAKMPPEAIHMSRSIDLIYFPILCILLVGTYHMHFMLLAGDWDFWLDWKDRQWWPVVTPIAWVLPTVQHSCTICGLTIVNRLVRPYVSYAY